VQWFPLVVRFSINLFVAFPTPPDRQQSRNHSLLRGPDKLLLREVAESTNIHLSQSYAIRDAKSARVLSCISHVVDPGTGLRFINFLRPILLCSGADDSGEKEDGTWLILSLDGLPPYEPNSDGGGGGGVASCCCWWVCSGLGMKCGGTGSEAAGEGNGGLCCISCDPWRYCERRALRGAISR
jgi:hypothetical protein